MSDDFAARCRGCGFTWNSPAMADGLRALGACPKCKGELVFGARAETSADVAGTEPAAAAPHLVLGLPRQR